MPRKTRTHARPILVRHDGECPFYKARELAAMLGVKLDTLRKWRVQGKGPAFVKETRRTIVYRKSAVQAWLAQAEQRVQTVEPRRKKKPNSTPSQESADVTA